ncbi:MAG TPA: sigma-54-dependent Fis family transcriptional regulator [Deltaproteobacteria bacterium]|nr:sigma-54-dependent Fis family transcriptional regulator [Deltaproteobacteria bacterium]HIJ41107.1 sigma-54-dependent Fis family transcriptional regulator [Deltaproteobacteria bacterium]
MEKAVDQEKLIKENLILRDQISRIQDRYSFESIVARSEAMARVFDLIKKVAEHKTTVLITGESGTGKELIAKAIHSTGSRSSERLITINCGGIPENLLESELFGYKKGAFTNALKDKPGHFSKADKGTLFLDEIGEMPFLLQVKLLRALQEQEIVPLGGVEPERIDVRVIVATSKDLSEEVKQGRFREDLYYRVHVMAIHLPPLRERVGDISLLAGYFIDLFNKKLKKSVIALSSDAMSIMMNYPWPGNVRELENVMERAVLLAPERFITPRELPPELILETNGRDLEAVGTLSIKKACRSLEKKLISKALKKTDGNRTQAALLLEISRPTLISKIKEYGL